MVGSTSPESLQKHRKIVINTTKRGVSRGASVTRDNFDPEADKGCVGMALGGLPDATGARGRGPTPNKIDIGVAQNRQTYKNMRVYR